MARCIESFVALMVHRNPHHVIMTATILLLGVRLFIDVMNRSITIVAVFTFTVFVQGNANVHINVM